MKIPTLKPAIGGLAIAIPIFYLGFYAYNNPAVGFQAKNDFSTELAIVKSDINALKKANTELNELKQKIAQLESQKANAVLQAQSQNAGETVADQADMMEESAKDPEQLAKEQEEQRAKQLAQMNSSFLAEPSGQQWASETTHLVSSFFESEQGAKIDVSDIQCRKTLCKVELNKVDRAKAGNELALNFPMHVGQALSQARYFHEQNADGTTNVTIYLARNGYELPAEL
jgi:hypothetical protein